MNLREIRQKKGISAKELAAKMAVNVNTISRWETGAREPDIPTLKRLAEIYECSIDELVNGLSENPRPPRKVAARRCPRGSGRKRAAQPAL